MADDGWIDTGTDDGQGGAWKDTDDAPVTAGGVAAQVGRGAEAAPYSLLGAGIDLPYNAWNAAKDMYYGVTGTGPYAKGAKPDPSTQPQPSPVSNWLQTQGGKVSPQLDPRNYPAQNWPERIARSAGQTGTEALIGRAATTGVQAFTDPSAVPSAIKIGKQLAGSWFSGAGAGAGAETGRGAAQRAVDIDPDFRRLHPAIADMIENAGGIVGGVAGGYGASSVANRFGFPAGDPRADFTSDQLLKTAGNQYEIAKNIPANYTTPSISKFAFDHSQALLGNYGSSEIQPIITRLNKLMNTPAGAQSVPLKELTTLDDYLGTVVKKNTDNMGNVSKLGGAAADTQTAIRNFIKNSAAGLRPFRQAGLGGAILERRRRQLGGRLAEPDPGSREEAGRAVWRSGRPSLETHRSGQRRQEALRISATTRKSSSNGFRRARICEALLAPDLGL